MCDELVCPARKLNCGVRFGSSGRVYRGPLTLKVAGVFEQSDERTSSCCLRQMRKAVPPACPRLCARSGELRSETPDRPGGGSFVPACLQKREETHSICQTPAEATCTREGCMYPRSVHGEGQTDKTCNSIRVILYIPTLPYSYSLSKSLPLLLTVILIEKRASTAKGLGQTISSNSTEQNSEVQTSVAMKNDCEENKSASSRGNEFCRTFFPGKRTKHQHETGPSMLC